MDFLKNILKIVLNILWWDQNSENMLFDEKVNEKENFLTCLPKLQDNHYFDRPQS